MEKSNPWEVFIKIREHIRKYKPEVVHKYDALEWHSPTIRLIELLNEDFPIPEGWATVAWPRAVSTLERVCDDKHS